MRKNDRKIFLNKPLLYEMLNLRLSGWALTSLAFYYGCDFTSIKYQCIKYQVEPIEDVYTIERMIRQIIPKSLPLSYKIVNGEKINLGKSYKEYCKTS